MKTLQNKRVLITGASGGLGRALAIAYKNAGCDVILTARTRQSLLIEEFECLGKYECDLANLESIQFMVDRVKKDYGGVDILVNCAGVFPVKKLHDMSLEEYNECIQVNLTAPFILTKEFHVGMMANGWGRIINIASSSAYGGSPDTSVYCASKHALLGLSRSLFKELKGRGIRVICVSPGSIKTRMGKKVEDLGQDYDTFMDASEVADYVVYNTKLGKDMVSEEIRLNRVFVQ